MGPMKKILLVEDNAGDAELTRLAFETAGVDCELLVADTAEAAMALLSKSSSEVGKYVPDIILLDLNLPGINGRDLLGRIKTDDRLSRIPVIAMSTSDAADDVDRCYDLHVNSYVRKPMDMNGFVSVIKAIDAFWFSVAELPSA